MTTPPPAKTTTTPVVPPPAATTTTTPAVTPPPPPKTTTTAPAPPKAATTTAPAPAPAHAGGPTPSSPPAVAQVVQQGRQLVGSVGSWAGSGAIAYGTQWYRCDASGAHCKSIRGATKSTYTLVAADVGQTLGFTVRASDAGGTTAAYASLVGPVAAASAGLVSTGQPLVTGTASVGGTVQVSSGGWTQAPASLGYQWVRCNANGRLCVPIAGATGASYVVTAEDAGHALAALVHATLGAAAQDALSTATAPAGVGPKVTVGPGVTGPVQQGRQLVGSVGSWAGSGAIAYGTQWYRCDASGAHCKSIHGATKSTYTLVAADVGQTLGFTVRASDAGGTTAAYASLVGPVAAASAGLVSTGQPLVTGTASVGGTVQVSSGGWTQAPASLGYQWVRCNANGRLCVPIAGATGASYVVTAEDAGHALAALVLTGTDAAAPAALSTAAGVP